MTRLNSGQSDLPLIHCFSFPFPFLSSAPKVAQISIHQCSKKGQVKDKSC